MKSSHTILAALVGLSLAWSASAKAGSLTDIGFPTGLSLVGNSASQTVYFPLPASSKGAILHLHVAASGLLEAHSGVTVTVNGVPVATLPDSAVTTPVDITIPPALTLGQFVQVAFIANQTIDSQDRCYDNYNQANWTKILPDTSLSAETSALQGVGAVWRTLGAPLPIALPAPPSLADLQAALTVSTALVERGIAPFFTTDRSSASIVIDPKAKSMAVTSTANNAPQITIPNSSSARALVAADALFRSTASSTAKASFVASEASPENIIPLGSLGIHPTTLDVLRDTKLTLSLPLQHLPANTHVQSLILSGNGAALPPGESEIISIEIAGSVIWSQAFTVNVAVNSAQISLPEHLVDTGAPVILHLVRVRNETDCEKLTPLPFTLLDDTALVVADGNPSPERFAGFSVAAGQPTKILTDLPPAMLPPSLPLLSELLAAAGANPVAIEVGDTSQSPSSPFILLSHSPGKIITIAPIPAATPGLIVPLPNQNTQIELGDTSAYSILQLVSAGAPGSLTPGIWLNPGTASSLAQAALPGEGNVAFYDGSSSPATFDTELHNAQFKPQTNSLLNIIFRNWNNELFGLFWLLFTILTIVILVRHRKIRK